MSAWFESHRPLVMGTGWMMSADHPLAAQAGAAVLQAGGNAVDAAVAANLALCVVRPHMCGLGGDLFALIHHARSGELLALNGSGRSPRVASLQAYERLGLRGIPESGPLSATVPGALMAWEEALARCGTLELADLLPPAIALARKGFPVYGELISAMRESRAMLEASPGCAAAFFPEGRLPKVGELLSQPLLADSLETVAKQGARAFYQGELGRSLVEYSKGLGGFFSMDDLAGHACDWQSPISYDYKGLTICTQPPSSQGAALLMQAGILENLDLAAMGPGSAACVHHMVEAKKLAFADRDKYICDPAFYPVPLAEMLDRQSAQEQAARIDPGRAAGAPAPRRFSSGGSDTIYLAAADSQGNAVSLIQSIFQPFGSGVMDPQTGIILHNRGCGFSMDPTHPNRLEPGKRPYHTLHPVMVLKQGRPFLVLGTPGADGQTQTNIQVLMNLLEFGADPQEAVEAPRWRSNPDGGLLLEGRFDPAMVAELRAMGHRIKLVEDYDEVMGSAQVIRIDQENGVFQAGACPRRQAYAIAG